jgi:hypothetical protein
MKLTVGFAARRSAPTDKVKRKELGNPAVAL